jgi:hypothetical protein
MMEHIVILVHQHDDFERERYLLHELAGVWRTQGLRVTVMRGIARRIDAGLVILHVDLTKVPADYLAVIRQCPRVMNGGVTDISKRFFSAQQVSRRDGYDGPVIIKTNRNSGGGREQALRVKGGRFRRYAGSIREKLPWAWRTRLLPSQYRIFESKKQVPLVAWCNPDMIVERFLPERREGYYCLRTWTFLGEEETRSISYSAEPVVKSRNVLRREPVTDVPEELRQIRKDLGFDYGKFDYGIVDDRVVLYDVNRTPTLGSIAKEQMPRFHKLADGIRAFLCSIRR